MVKTVIDAHNISKVYNPQTIPVYAVNNVHLHLQEGEFTALVGPSGSGKTTLLKIITGRLEGDGGNVQLARGAKIGYLRQEAPVTVGLTVLEEAEQAVTLAAIFDLADIPGLTDVLT